jgi:energy-coupling factor transporter ATP-binding protein EcfA2
MLVQLSIRDIVLIDKLDLKFDRGLTILTGETGAGKSILLDAFSLALGARGAAAWSATARRKVKSARLSNLRRTTRRWSRRRHKTSKPPAALFCGACNWRMAAKTTWSRLQPGLALRSRPLFMLSTGAASDGRPGSKLGPHRTGSHWHG